MAFDFAQIAAKKRCDGDDVKMAIEEEPTAAETARVAHRPSARESERESSTQMPDRP